MLIDLTRMQTQRSYRVPADYIEKRDKGDKTFGGTKYEALSDRERDALLFEVLPWMRGQVSAKKRVIGKRQPAAQVIRTHAD